jgi:hypothetical protein
MIASFSNYSFVQFQLPATTGCAPDPALCLPMSDPNNWQFYLYIDELDISNYTDISRVLFYAYAVPTDTGSPPSDLSTYNPQIGHGPAPVIFANHFDPSAGSSMTVHFDWSSGGFYNIAPGECFKLMIAYLPIKVDGQSRYISAWPMKFVGFTNSFQRTDGVSCYTSVISYTNNSDAFDFRYLWGKPNVAELPMYLRDPKMENDQKVYTKSDGTLVKLYERKEDVYMLETDLMPYAWHKALDVALSHDNVQIKNINASHFDPIGTTSSITTVGTTVGSNPTTYTSSSVIGDPVYDPAHYSSSSGGTTVTTNIALSMNNAINFTKKENYEIEYNKSPLSDLGKGSCKLSNAKAIHLINNNCG